MDTAKSGIKIKTTSLANYQVIDKPGTYILKCLNNVSEKNLVKNETTGRESYIANFAAIAPDKLGQVHEVFQGKQEVDVEDTSGLFLTGNIWKNGSEIPALPMKGEEVKATVDYVMPRKEEGEEESGELVLRVTNVQVQAAKKAEKLDITKFFATATAEKAETLTQKV